MDSLQFLQSVELTTGLDREAARQAAEETLTTLAERLGRPVAAELASAMPSQLRPPLAAPAEAEAFDADEFVRRTALREGSTTEQASQHVRAVFGTLKEDVAAVDRLRDRLPPDYRDLFA
ncbi:MAG TPA: DUF2267 domain-containing protein [Actinomycetota bacterium]|nr:DUF2267 domain-containing protein [Actinomycetota bacterium]